MLAKAIRLHAEPTPIHKQTHMNAACFQSIRAPKEALIYSGGSNRSLNKRHTTLQILAMRRYVLDIAPCRPIVSGRSDRPAYINMSLAETALSLFADPPWEIFAITTVPVFILIW